MRRRTRSRAFALLLAAAMAAVPAGVQLSGGGMPVYADQETKDGFVLSDDGRQLLAYRGPGGNITVPTGVTMIAAGVFQDNRSLTGITFPSTVTSMGTGVFAGCEELQKVNLGNVTSIPADTFRDCVSLSNPSMIPATVKSIEANAFNGCNGLNTINLPNGITNIDITAFDNCKNLRSFTLQGSSGTYTVYDGCLYKQRGTVLYKVPTAKSSITFSSNVSTIGTNSFSGNYEIETVVLPETVTTIEQNAFADSGVKVITIPASVTMIGAQANWKPTLIYSIEGAAGYEFANKNNVTFVRIGEEAAINTGSTSGGSSTVISGGTDTTTITGGSTNTNIVYRDEEIDVVQPARVTIKKIAQVKGKKLKVTIGSVSDSDGYCIAYRKNGASNWTKKFFSETEYTMSGLENAKTYQVAVCAYAGDGTYRVYGNWSVIKYKKTDSK